MISAGSIPMRLDEYTSIILSDGERCYIKELVPYTEEDERKENVEPDLNS